ncbi:MAG: hypothetical protein IPJ67_02065 [Candidatus Moraniibacteriota bacterium]|nr:MAG: hypothetical protein IPJ67_02065 [Candidatus Moranbacteria bacterium]
MDRHFQVFEKKVHGFLERAETQWFLQDIQPYLGAVIMLLTFFFRENISIGRFIRSMNLGDKSLAENEALWLISEEGAFAFMKKHEHLISAIRRRFSEEELLQARIFAQCILFHDDTNCFLVGIARGHPPTDLELSGDESLKVRWSFRLLLAIYDERTYRKNIAREIAKMLPT